MSLVAVGSAGLLLILSAFGADDPIPGSPALKASPEPIPVTRKLRHYVVQVKLIEVDDQGKETVLGEPRLQTTGGNAGISVDHSDGRRFEFTMRLTDRLGSADDLMPARTMAPNSEETLLKKLDQKIDLNVQQQSRREILREITRRAGINFAIDPDSERSVAGDFEIPLNIAVKDEAAGDVIDRLLQPFKLGYIVRHDVVLIATSEKLVPAPEDFVVKTYDVADLVKASDETGREAPNFRPLIERIKSTVQPTSWDRKEASATIRPFNSTQSIVVRQTAYAHSSIDRLLDRIRHEQPRQFAE